MDAATRELIAEAPIHSVDDLESMIASARSAQPKWASLGHATRSEILHAVADRIDASAEELSQLLSREQGKPLNGPNARFELGACTAWLRSAADAILEAEVLVDDEGTHAELSYRPVGIVAAIGPWNWPLMIAIWQIGPSLRMGNSVIVKPSEHTPLSVLALVSVMNEVLPPGILSAVSGDREIGARIASHPGIDKVMFTGSTATGRKIIEASSANLARLTLELGGNDAAIVLHDVNPTRIAEDLFWAAFVNTGQTCAALKRLYVHESVYEDLLAALKKVTEATPMGNGLEDHNLLGPMQNEQQFDIVSRLVADAIARGGRIVSGGAPAPELGPLFFKPTLIADLQDGDPLVDEEQFGPALPIIKYSDVDEAIRSANRLDVGLGASVWSSDIPAANQVAQQLQAGTVWINKHGALDPRIPFGGVKASGYGLEFSVEGLKSVGVPQVIWQ